MGGGGEGGEPLVTRLSATAADLLHTRGISERGKAGAFQGGGIRGTKKGESRGIIQI